MVVGQFLNITNYRQFEHVGRQVMQLADMDPALVFESAVPGFIGRVTREAGAWPGREQKGFEFPSKLAGASAVSANERARKVGYDKRQIVALPGIEIAGKTQSVQPIDFMYNGMSQAEVTRRAMRPRLDWNKSSFSLMMDVLFQNGKSTGAPVQEAKWSVLDQAGNTVQKSLVTESTDQTADVIANATQTILWPLRTGEEAAANHDHVFNNAGAAWTLALARTARDTILEHPGAGLMVDAYVGSAVAEAIRGVMKSELGAVVTREEFIRLSIASAGGLGGAVPITLGLEGVNYFYSPDIDANQALYVAGGQKPFYHSKGALGINGESVGTGPWFEPGNVETRGGDYGYRDYINGGTENPIGAAVVDYVA